MEFLVQEALKNNQAEIFEENVGNANIKVVGIGGAGCNMVSWL